MIMPTFDIFPWNNNFESGIPIIDEQHRKLVDLLNKLVRNIARQSTTVELTSIFAEIKAYVLFHFSAEEGIWKDHFEGDVWEKWHHQSHEDFITEVAKLESRIGARPQDETLLDIVRFLTHWLARHILDSDKRMAKVVLALPSGISLARAKEAANEEMAGSTKLLIDTLMTMYDKLADSTVQMSREIQRRRSAEEELLKANQVVEAASRAKSAFLANMSHELRSPLNTILGYSDLMRQDPTLTDSHCEILGIIHRSGTHLLDMINDVLELTKFEAGHVQLAPAAFDLSATAADVMEMLSLRAREKGLKLILEPPVGLHGFVVCDEAKVRQILINLLSNAIKATPSGQVVLRLGAVLTNSPTPPQLFLEVIDTGVGIAPADQQRIFEPFEQVGSHNSWQGTGLGLAICRQFVGLMGGRIEVRSSLGQGSSFRVELPLVLAAAQPSVNPTRARGSVVGIEPGQGSVRVMVVDDDADNRSLMTQWLQRVGFEVQQASSGADAIATFSRVQPQFIWMDWRMPDMDGIQTAQRLRAMDSPHPLKIAAITASSSAEYDKQLQQAGFDAVMHKPLNPEQIYERMEQLLALRLIRTQADTVVRPNQPLDAGAIAALPPALRQELADTLLLLNQEHALAVIARIEAHHGALAESLRQGVALYQFTSMRQQLLGLSADRPNPS